MTSIRIAAAANVLTPAYLTIISKGYAVRKDGDLLIASKDEDTFIAEDPIVLLGLIVVGEVRGERWLATDGEIETFLANFG